MLQPEKLPVECGNFLADLPRYLGLGEPAIEKDVLYPHVRSCARCQKNFRTAREIAGAFHGMKAQISQVDIRTVTVERAVAVALRESKTQLADAFFQLGKAFLLDAVNQNGWIAPSTPRVDPSTARQRGMNIANDSVILSKDQNDIGSWNQWRLELANIKVPKESDRRLDEAFRYFAVTRRIQPNHSSSMIGIGLCHRERNEFKQAMDAYQLVLDESRSTARLIDAHNNLSDALCHMDRFSDGAQEASLSLEISPQDPTALYNLALNSFCAGNRKDAFEVFEIIENDSSPDLKSLNRARQILKGFGEGPFARCLRANRVEINSLEKSFPKVFSADVVSRIRAEV